MLVSLDFLPFLQCSVEASFYCSLSSVTPMSHLFSVLWVTSLAGLLPVWGSPPMPGSLTGYERPSPGWASVSTPFPHYCLFYAVGTPGAGWPTRQ